jgi:hypothetical protein
MVAAVRGGRSMRWVAQRFRVSLLTVQRWFQRAKDLRLDRVDFSNRPAGPRQPANRVAQKVEDRVLTIRRQLREESNLGEFGAAALRRELLGRGRKDVPALATINRILERRGALDARGRVRRPAPPPGWYLPDVAATLAEIDLFDIVSGLLIPGGPEVEVFNTISLHGGLVGSWPGSAIHARTVREAILGHWRQFGLPDYAQFDNDTRFQGPHQHPDVISSVMRLCLSLQVVPVFVPPRETGFQATLESFNGRWQAKVWARFHHESLQALRAQSAKYVAACRKNGARRIEAAPERRPFPKGWQLDLQAHPPGRLLLLRRTTDRGEVQLLGHTFLLDPLWPHRLVRCEVDLHRGAIRCYALRRREPQVQPMLRAIAYTLPFRRFRE